MPGGPDDRDRPGRPPYRDTGRVPGRHRARAGAGGRRRYLSPVALAELALDLAAEAEPAINAYASFRRDAALREAAELEAEARPDGSRSACTASRSRCKDNMYLAGEPTYKGSGRPPGSLAAGSARRWSTGSSVPGRW